MSFVKLQGFKSFFKVTVAKYWKILHNAKTITLFQNFNLKKSGGKIACVGYGGLKPDTTQHHPLIG